MRIKTAVALVLAALVAPFAWAAGAEKDARIGIVVMHGKGGAPTKHVAGLARALEANGYLVANLEMPWSGDRRYDVDARTAEQEVSAALTALRERGAAKVFIAGHSQGGVFALHCAGLLPADGVIAIAPGGNVASKLFRENLGDVVGRARRLVAEGKGDARTELADFESSKGTFPIVTTPAVYLTWFDHDSAMNVERAARAARPAIPILWIVAQNDYPGLRKVNLPLFRTLKSHPLTQLYEPNSNHLGAPSASAEEIIRWTTAVAAHPAP